VDSRSPSPRVAVAFQGDATDPGSWSGAPAGLWGGLGEAGVERVAIDARFAGAERAARALRMSWSATTASPAFARLSGRSAGRAARRAGVDGAVAIGSGFLLPASVRAVTFEDMTVAQALRTDDPTYRGLPAKRQHRWRQRQGESYARAVACCATSRWTADSIVADYGIPRAQVHVVGFGRKMGAAANPGRDWSVPRFAFVGFDWERKGGAAVLAAFAGLRRRVPAATLDLVGAHPPVDAPGVTGHGRLELASAADQGKLAAILDRSTCMVMPSAYEPFGIAYVDAGARGIASIGTTVGGGADAIGPGGVLVAPGDAAALAAAMDALADPQTARELGARAAEHADLLTWDKVAERVLRALRPPGLELDGLAQFLV
jgi:glycosyltransferase involved in cell wall biosynthesis